MNKRSNGSTIKESQLPAEFASDDFNVLIVAEKYQTGFDEPLLHTMFVDKKLSGVKAVQTLSRLNRVHPEKNDTFILDFVNTKEEIEEAFKPFYEATILDEEVNINLIYNTRTFLREYLVYGPEDVEKFAGVYFKKGRQTDKDLGKIASILKPVVARYTQLDEDARFNFKKTLRNFIKWYSYITQVVRMYDKELHKEHTFAVYLERLLPKVAGSNVDLEDKLQLEFYKLEQTFKGEIVLDPSEEGLRHRELRVEDGVPPEDEHLEEITKRINERYKGKFTEGDRVMMETIFDQAYQGENNKTLERYAKNNDFEVFSKSIFPEIFKQIAQECYMGSIESFTKLFEDKEFYGLMMEEVGREVYKKFKSK